jgi:hypothetical protein
MTWGAPWDLSSWVRAFAMTMTEPSLLRGENRRHLMTINRSSVDGSKAYPRHFPPYYDRCSMTHLDVGRCALVVCHLGDHAVLTDEEVLFWNGPDVRRVPGGDVVALHADVWYDA